jgi:hypothetical protein
MSFIFAVKFIPMVNIERANSNFIFEIKGLHKLWALKSQLTIPVDHILKAYPYDKKIHSFFGLRMPGTQIPGIITAGTYLVDDGSIFCDIVNPSKSIVVELSDEHYKRLIIEVEEPEKAIAMLLQKDSGNQDK